MTREDYDRAMKLHFWAPYELVSQIVPEMRLWGRGRIVNISSIGGKVALPHFAPYSASKFALEALAEVYRYELAAQGIDSVILCGATTSGCIRATAIDLLQYGWPTLVPRECVGDRAQAPHEANLFDIQAKYADVVPLEDALAYLETVPERAGVA